MAQDGKASTAVGYCLAGAAFGYVISGVVSRPAAIRVALRRPSIAAAEGTRVDVELSEERLAVRHGGVEEAVAWQDIHYVVEAREGFCFACGMGVTPLPAVAFASKTERDVARSWIRSRLPAEARALSLLTRE
jgi:hypothetical protein